MDTKYARNVANEGRGSMMCATLHDACDEIDRLQALNAELVAALEIIARGDADRGLQMRDIARAALAKAKEAQS